jgi:hypothetical protein
MLKLKHLLILFFLIAIKAENKEKLADYITDISFSIDKKVI